MNFIQEKLNTSNPIRKIQSYIARAQKAGVKGSGLGVKLDVFSIRLLVMCFYYSCTFLYHPEPQHPFLDLMGVLLLHSRHQPFLNSWRLTSPLFSSLVTLLKDSEIKIYIRLRKHVGRVFYLHQRKPFELLILVHLDSSSVPSKHLETLENYRCT